jgi:hypothetical protein
MRTTILIVALACVAIIGAPMLDLATAPPPAPMPSPRFIFDLLMSPVLGPAVYFRSSLLAYPVALLPCLICLAGAVRNPTQRWHWLRRTVYWWAGLGAAPWLPVGLAVLLWMAGAIGHVLVLVAAVALFATLIACWPPAGRPKVALMVTLAGSVICTAASASYQRSYVPHPCPALILLDTGPCDEALPAGGFPLAFLYDVSGISVQGTLGPEDHIEGWPLLADLTFYTGLFAALALVRRRIEHRRSLLRRRFAIP